ncbi:MAG: DUF5027 family lipoprotein [Lachnospiraceae bacterium]|jgi:predicted small lipoprotein YifL|nr:DUF5027 family lipoprotein [Lachnospiraceae bacterium]
MLHRKKTYALRAIVLCTLFLLTACGSKTPKNIPDNLPDISSEPQDSADKNQPSSPDNQEPSQESQEPSQESQELSQEELEILAQSVPTAAKDEVKNNGSLYALGSPVPTVYWISDTEYQTGSEYTIQDAAIFESCEAADIDPDQTYASDLYDVATGVPSVRPLADGPLLKCNLNIKNISYEPTETQSINDIYLVYWEPETNKVKLISHPAYFSSSTGIDEMGWGYCDYELEKGGSFDTTIAFPVDMEQCEKENLYLCMDFHCEQELWKFVDLGL